MIALVDCAEEHRWLLLEWRNSERVAPFMLDHDRITPDVHDIWYSRLLERQGRRGWIITAVGRPVGAAFVSGIETNDSRGEFGLYLADESTRGKGIGMAALFLLCEEVFNAMQLHKLSCQVLSSNRAAIALYRKVGFEEEGVLRDHVRRDGTWINVHALAMFAVSWERRRHRLRDELEGRELIA